MGQRIVLVTALQWGHSMTRKGTKADGHSPFHSPCPAPRSLLSPVNVQIKQVRVVKVFKRSCSSFLWWTYLFCDIVRRDEFPVVVASDCFVSQMKAWSHSLLLLTLKLAITLFPIASSAAFLMCTVAQHLGLLWCLAFCDGFWEPCAGICCCIFLRGIMANNSHTGVRRHFKNAFLGSLHSTQ